jgi:DNA primase
VTRWPIDEILARTDLAALLDEFAQPAQRGRRWHCPLTEHDDHHASVTMRRDHRGHERWRCWSGDHRGDAVDLIQTVRHCDRAAAIDELATRAGMFPDRELPPVPPRKPVGLAPAVDVDPRVVGYAQICARLLWTPLGAPVRDWLHARGLNDEILAANHVGADPGRDRLRRAKGIPYGHGLGATFPALDHNGEIRYVQTRPLEPRPDHGKYDNPAGHMAPNPRLSFAHPAHSTDSCQLVICEGIPDALVAAQAGFRSVALLGSNALDPSVAARIANHAHHHDLDVVVVTDHDTAGKRLSDHLLSALCDLDVDARVVTPPLGQDLSSWALEASAWRAYFLEGSDLLGNRASREQAATREASI